MLRAWDFQLPTQIQFGRGGLRKLGEFCLPLGRTALLVGYQHHCGLDDAYLRAAKSLAKAGVRVEPFFQIPPEPGIEVAQLGAELARGSGVEVIVGLGGGSVIDAAKAIALLARRGASLDGLFDGENPSPPIDDALPLVAVPTTAGTGSEASDIAVFQQPGTDREDDVPRKSSIWAATLRPKLALVDPDLALGTPAPITAACAADALGHALEARLSRRCNPVAAALAARAVALIVENLPLALETPDAPSPREALALAATLSGVAFTSAGVTVGHALAQALGAVLHLPHGVTVAVATPIALRYNAGDCAEALSDLARQCPLTTDPAENRPARWIERIAQLLRNAGLPDRVAMPTPMRDNLVERLVRSAQGSARVPILLNPRKTDEAALAGLFRQALQ
jgi:alcohol dehydrogenase class IV